MSQYCRWCDKEFTSNAKHQIYCSIPCREEATKKKVAERTARKKVKSRIGKTRICSNCKIALSIYNENPMCHSCYVDKKKLDKTLKEIKRFFDYEKS
jgi:hypothetical protein